MARPARRGNSGPRFVRRAKAVLALTLVASAAVAIQTRREQLLEGIRRRGLDPRQIVIPFEVTEEMVEWARSEVGQRGREEDRLTALLEALMSSDAIKLEYHSRETGTAQEVFATGRANCMGFTHIFVGLARELGIDAYFVRVEEILDANREGDLVVLEEHVTGGFGPPHSRMILDFSLIPVEERRSMRPISDLTAVALYYSNRGAELVRQEDYDGALEWLSEAVQLDPELADAWINLGVARRRAGDTVGAEQAYERALEANPQAISAYYNLAALLRIRGEEDGAFELLALTDQLHNRDPYNYIALGDLSMRRRNLEDANRYYRRAARLMPDEAAGYAALGHWALEAGQRRQAKRWLKKAMKRDPEDPRAQSLERRLAGEAQP